MSSPNPSPIRDATQDRRGLVGIAAQTWAGIKKFLDPIILAARTTGTLPAGGSELEGSILYNTTTKRAQIHDGTSWVPVVMSVTGESAASLEEHILGTNAHNAANIGYSGTLTSVKVGAALDELDTDKAGLASDNTWTGKNTFEEDGDGWQNVTLGEGWTTVPGEQVPQYRIDSFGRVWFRGAVARTVDAVLNAIVSLPPEATPTYKSIRGNMIISTGIGVTAGSYFVYPPSDPNTGSIYIFGFGGATVTEAYLHDICYYV